jgi:hypothetical protein
MSGATISVIVAIVGVGGTLASAVITQVLAQRAELRRLEREERIRLEEQRASEDQRKIDQLRSCYVQLSAHDRHYRDAMLAYAYALKSGSFEAAAAEVSSARRAQRDTRAEAQLVTRFSWTQSSRSRGMCEHYAGSKERARSLLSGDQVRRIAG